MGGGGDKQAGQRKGLVPHAYHPHLQPSKDQSQTPPKGYVTPQLMFPPLRCTAMMAAKYLGLRGQISSYILSCVVQQRDVLSANVLPFLL